MKYSSLDPAAPLLVSTKGAPRLYRVLGASLHLEPLVPSDASALADVADIVHDWVGPELRWATSSTFPLIDPYRRQDIDYVPGYADALRPPVPSASQEQRNIENILFAATFGEFTLLTSGGEQPTFASPYSYIFSSEMHQSSPGEGLHTCATMRITVPQDYPLGEFLERVCMIAAKLRIRWGAAGLTYAAWENAAYNEVRETIFAHCRRHVGYDMGQYAAYLEEWHREVRTANWLTLLGEELATRVLAAGGKLESQGSVDVFRAGGAIVLRAGPRPEEGDINRLDVPSAYVDVDKMIRTVRAGSGVDFRSPWDRATSEQWLRRFEKRVS